MKLRLTKCRKRREVCCFDYWQYWCWPHIASKTLTVWTAVITTWPLYCTYWNIQPGCSLMLLAVFHQFYHDSPKVRDSLGAVMLLKVTLTLAWSKYFMSLWTGFMWLRRESNGWYDLTVIGWFFKMKPVLNPLNTKWRYVYLRCFSIFERALLFGDSQSSPVCPSSKNNM